MATLSVIIITKNEEKNIERCIQSITWADEIIIVDSGSADRTVEIAKKLGAQVHHQDWLGFGLQKNKALSYATSDWVLSLDADEFLKPQDSDKLKNLLKSNPDASAYSLLFEVYFCGKRIKYSYGRNERHVRLFKRSDAYFDDAEVHENLIVKGKTVDCDIVIGHHTVGSVAQMIDKMQRYTRLSAQQKFEKNKTASVASLPFRTLMGFLRSYIFRLGFLDGKHGYIIAVAEAHSVYYRYLQLIERNGKL